MSVNQPRSGDGRFGSVARSEAPLGLTPSSTGGTGCGPRGPGETAATTTDQKVLWAAVRADDPAVRIAAMDNPALTGEQIDDLIAPTQEAVVRHSAGALPYPRASSAAVNDRNPLVRAIAGADLTSDRRAREVVAALAGWGSG